MKSIPCKILLLAFCLLPALSYGQQNDDIEQYLNTELSKDISKVDFTAIEDLADKEKVYLDQKYKRIQNNGSKKPWDPPTFRAVLKKGSYVLDVETGKSFQVQRKIYVNAREKTPGSSDSYIYNKQNKIRYLTKTTNVESIETDVSMYPHVDPNVVYKEPTKFNSTNKEFPLRNDFLFVYEAMQSDYFKQIYRGTDTFAQGTKFEIKSHYQSHLPIHLGVNANLSQGSWEDSTLGRASWQAMFIGPSALITLGGNGPEDDWGLYFSVQKSLYHNSEKNPDEHKFSSSAWQFDILKATNTGVGPIVFGAGYRMIRSSVKDSSEYLEIPSERGSTHAFTISFGYRYNWIL